MIRPCIQTNLKQSYLALINGPTPISILPPSTSLAVSFFWFTTSDLLVLHSIKTYPRITMAVLSLNPFIIISVRYGISTMIAGTRSQDLDDFVGAKFYCLYRCQLALRIRKKTVLRASYLCHVSKHLYIFYKVITVTTTIRTIIPVVLLPMSTAVTGKGSRVFIGVCLPA